MTFFTRIPIPWEIPVPKKFHQINFYYSLIGLLIGLILALIFYSLGLFLSKDIALLITLIFSLFLTGALHEDGLADSADALFGGSTPEIRLKILKDSSLGTYGALALISSFLFKFFLLREAPLSQIPYVFILIHPLSRFFSTLLMFKNNYAQTLNSKSEGIAKDFSWLALFLNFLPGAFCLYYKIPFPQYFYFLILIPFMLIFRQYVTKKIKGYTGDLVGCAQQISELGLLLILGVIKL